jgi:Flp pilus assembly protein TadG
MAGTVVVLLCAALTVDYGTLLADRNRLQRACDAGALAGASYLQRTGLSQTDETTARSQAVSVARDNGLSSDEVTDADVDIFDNDTKVRVHAHRTRQLFFVRIAGIKTGLVTAQATAGTTPFSSPQILPIGITTETLNTYRNDRGLHDLTLCRPQDTDFYQSLGTGYDPFVLTDLRSQGDDGSHGSPAQMERQLAGDTKVPVSVGDSPSSLRDSMDSQSSKFEDGMGVIFQKAAGSPWQDPATGVTDPPWSTVGTQFYNILSGQAPGDNPRIAHLFVTNGVAQQSGNFNYPVLSFVPVYIENITDTGGVVNMGVHFLDPGSGYNSQPVSLLD